MKVGSVVVIYTANIILTFATVIGFGGLGAILFMIASVLLLALFMWVFSWIAYLPYKLLSKIM